MNHLYRISFFVFLTFAWPVAAHHSEAGYDRNAVVAFEAKVVRYIYGNPHVTIFVETENASGDTEEWEIETGSTPIMTRSGWSADILSPGDTIRVRAHPERSGRHRAILNTIETADGRLWMQVDDNPEVTVAATSINGVWRGHSDYRARQGGDQALTPAAEAALAEFDYFRDSPVADCIAPPPPSLIGTVTYLNGIEVLEDQVILRNEYFDQTRIVYLDGRDHPQSGARNYEGHSTGYWEGNTLVVDTVRFADHPSGNGRGIPSGVQKHMVERYALNVDGTRVRVNIFVEDPEFLAEPFVGRSEMIYTPELELFRYDCDPVLSRQRGFE